MGSMPEEFKKGFLSYDAAQVAWLRSYGLSKMSLYNRVVYLLKERLKQAKER